MSTSPENRPEPRDVDAISGVETTGHEWDGIKELNNPLPRWWLWIFFATVIWSIGYMVFMPSFPGVPGLRGHTERANVAADLLELEAQRAPFTARLEAANLEQIQADPELLNIAMIAGEVAFKNRCATCHGAGAQGARGYPNLNDDVWIWGGTFEDIRTTIQYGIRNEHPDTRFSLMPAFGRDELLTPQEVRQVSHYVRSLTGLSDNAEAIAAGAELYKIQCASCHGVEGLGDRTVGALNLADNEWLYGSEPEAIYESIFASRNSAMPAWDDRLDEATITALAVWVHTRGGGE